MVYGDQFQIRLDPSKLEAKNRGTWGRLYIEKQAEKAKLFFSASSVAVAAALAFTAGIQLGDLFFPLGFFLGALALKSFYDFGYQKGIIDDWETKVMIRVDK